MYEVYFKRVHFKRGHPYQGKHEHESWTWVEQGYYVNSYCMLMLIIIVNKELHHLYLNLYGSYMEAFRKILNVLKIIHCE